MDVPVIISDMLHHSFVENVEVPQTQFFDRVVVLLLSQRQGCTVQTVQKIGDSPGAVLGLVGTPVVVQRQVLGFTEQKTVDVPQLQFLDKVAVCLLLYYAEARGDSTGAVLGQVVTCPLL